jgi:LCP family protein required for cell wall assembly
MNNFKKRYVILISLLILGILIFINRESFVSAFNPVKIVGQVQLFDLKETDGRTNILVLGSDSRDPNSVESTLTDTMILVSISRFENNVVMISLPRDLWVASPSGVKAKINSIYAFTDATELMAVVEDVTGVPVHYYGVVNFSLFQEVVDILGGVEVTVDQAFQDFYYPIPGKENAPEDERYEVLTFKEGTQIMDGNTALKFVRSRKGNNGEGTDFARAKRQQKVITAIKDTALKSEVLFDLSTLKKLYEFYVDKVDTNITLTDIQSFAALSQQINFSEVRSFVLDDRSAADDGGLLYAPEDREPYGGAYVLLPKESNYSQVHAYIQKYIFADL